MSYAKNIPNRAEITELRADKLAAEKAIGATLQTFLDRLGGLQLAPETRVTLEIATTVVYGKGQGVLQVDLVDLQIQSKLRGPAENGTSWELQL